VSKRPISIIWGHNLCILRSCGRPGRTLGNSASTVKRSVFPHRRDCSYSLPSGRGIQGAILEPQTGITGRDRLNRPLKGRLRLRHSNKTRIYCCRLQSPRPALSGKKVLNVLEARFRAFSACRLGLGLFARPRNEPGLVRVPKSCLSKSKNKGRDEINPSLPNLLHLLFSARECAIKRWA